MEKYFIKRKTLKKLTFYIYCIIDKINNNRLTLVASVSSLQKFLLILRKGKTMKNKRWIAFLLAAIMLMVMLAGCQTGSEDAEEATEESSEAMDITLEDVNRFLNESAGLGEGSPANAVAVIPYTHIDGPRNEETFYAFVTFQYKARNYIKYQVNYVSCTCRPAAVNYWQTLYAELTLPDSANIDDAEIKYLSFDFDPDGHYRGGLWGDSDPTPAEATYDMFKTEYIPYFQDKTYGEIKDLSTMEDIDLAEYQAGEGRGDYTIDTFTGSSVSANNIIRVLQGLFEFHGTQEHFEGEGTEATEAEEPVEETETTEEAAEETAEETETADEPQATESRDFAVLPPARDTDNMYKPSKDEDETNCEEDSYAAGCSSIGTDNLIDYLGRDDVFYVDLRDYSDYAQKHFRNFECIPFFGFIWDEAAGTDPEKIQLYGGPVTDPVPNYEESDELLEELFPKDKPLLIMCQSGGRVTMLMEILEARGWDMSQVYNVGGLAQYTDSKYDPYLVDTLEFVLDGAYNIEGLSDAE